MTSFEKNTIQPQQKSRAKPCDTDLENAVLGAILIDRDCINNIFGELRKELFYDSKNIIIYDAIVHLFCNSIPIDIRTVNNRIREMGLSKEAPAHHISNITSDIASSYNTQKHILILKELSMRRQIITLAEKALEEAYDNQKDVFEVLEKADTELVNITNGNFGKSTISMEEAMFETIDEILDFCENGGTMTLSSGVESLDRIIGGFFPGELSMIAARPSMGKTTVAMHVLRSIAQTKKNVGFISLEMSAKSLSLKETVTEFYRHDPNSMIDVIRLRMGKLSPQEKEILSRIKDQINQYINRIKISQKSSMTLGGIKSQAKEWVRKYDIKILVIDYLQLIGGDDQSKKSDTRNLELERVANGLKTLSKELNIPIIALAQLNRGVENRASKIPQLSDLRDSGGLEQAADNITFLYRPEYYDIMQDDKGNSTNGLLELVVAKNRNGQLGKASSQINLKAGTIHTFDNVDFKFSEFLKEERNQSGAPANVPQAQLGGEKADDLPF